MGRPPGTIECILALLIVARWPYRRGLPTDPRQILAPTLDPKRVSPVSTMPRLRVGNADRAGCYACSDAVLIRDRYSRLGAATGMDVDFAWLLPPLANGLVEGAEGMARQVIGCRYRALCNPGMPSVDETSGRQAPALRDSHPG